MHAFEIVFKYALKVTVLLHYEAYYHLGLNGATSQKIVLIITTAVRTSNPTLLHYIHFDFFIILVNGYRRILVQPSLSSLM
jgi:hypothetical protein